MNISHYQEHNKATFSPVFWAVYIFAAQLVVLFDLMDNYFGSFLIIFLFSVTFIIYFAIRRQVSRIVYVFAIYLYSPLVTIPADGLKTLIGSYPNILLATDRIGVAFIVKLALMLAMILSLLKKNLHVRNKVFLISIILVILSSLFSLYKWRISENYSYIHAIYDIIQYATILCLTILIGTQSKDDNQILVDGTINVLMVFVLIVFFEYIISILNFFSWSYSYRDSLRGVFSGSEVIFSFRLGLSVIFVIYKFRRNLNKIIFASIFIGALILHSKIKTTIASILIILIVVYFMKVIYKQGAPNRRVLIPFIVAFMIGTGFTYIKDIDLYKPNSILSRVGTVIAGYVAFSDNAIFGLGTGISDISQITNVASNIYSYDYRYYLLTFVPYEAISGELVERYEYNDVSNSFNPHQTPILIIYSLGLVSLPFILIFYKYQIERIFKYVVSNNYKKVTLAACLFYIILFTLLHPLFFTVETMYLVLSLQPFNLLNTQINAT